MNKNPIKATTQNKPPLKNVHAALLKFQKLPHQTGEYHATKIAPISNISPNNSSSHLFMQGKEVIHLKSFLW